MKNKWYFVFQNDWNVSYEGFNVEILSVNWQNDFRRICIFGFSFVWEKLAYQRNKK